MNMKFLKENEHFAMWLVLIPIFVPAMAIWWIIDINHAWVWSVDMSIVALMMLAGWFVFLGIFGLIKLGFKTFLTKLDEWLNRHG